MLQNLRPLIVAAGIPYHLDLLNELKLEKSKKKQAKGIAATDE